MDPQSIASTNVETEVLLSRETNPLTVEVGMEVETGEVKEHPTYKRIQEYVQEKYGLSSGYLNNCLICVITIGITIRTAKGKIYAEIYRKKILNQTKFRWWQENCLWTERRRQNANRKRNRMSRAVTGRAFPARRTGLSRAVRTVPR